MIDIYVTTYEQPAAFSYLNIFKLETGEFQDTLLTSTKRWNNISINLDIYKSHQFLKNGNLLYKSLVKYED